MTTETDHHRPHPYPSEEVCRDGHYVEQGGRFVCLRCHYELSDIPNFSTVWTVLRLADDDLAVKVGSRWAYESNQRRAFAAKLSRSGTTLLSDLEFYPTNLKDRLQLARTLADLCTGVEGADIPRPWLSLIGEAIENEKRLRMFGGSAMTSRRVVNGIPQLTEEESSEVNRRLRLVDPAVRRRAEWAAAEQKAGKPVTPEMYAALDAMFKALYGRGMMDDLLSTEPIDPDNPFGL